MSAKQNTMSQQGLQAQQRARSQVCKYCAQKVPSHEMSQAIHLFGPHFYACLTGGLSVSPPIMPKLSVAVLCREPLKRCMHRVDLFPKDCIVLAVNMRKHWILVNWFVGDALLENRHCCHMIVPTPTPSATTP